MSKDSLNCVANKKKSKQNKTNSVVGKLIQPPKRENSKIALILYQISSCKQTVNMLCVGLTVGNQEINIKLLTVIF